MNSKNKHGACKPYTWKDLTVSMGYALQQADTEQLNPLEREVRNFSILSGIPETFLMRMDLDEFRSVEAEATSGLDKKDAVPYVEKQFTVNGRTYVPAFSIESINVAAYIDWTEISKAAAAHAKLEKSHRMPEDDFRSLLSVIIIPEGHAYNDGYDMKQVKSDIGDMPFLLAQGIWTVFQKACEALLHYRVELMRRRLKKALKKADKKTVKAIQDALKTLEATIGWPL